MPGADAIPRRGRLLRGLRRRPVRRLLPPRATRRRRLQVVCRLLRPRVVRRLLVAATVLGTVAAPAAVPLGPDRAAQPAALRLVSAQAHHRHSHHKHRWPGHPGRWIKHYTVKRGDTATGLAVKYHAWTDELLAINHLGPSSTLYVGDHIKIPIVVAAARKHRHHGHHHKRHHDKNRHPKNHHKSHHKRHHRSHHKNRHRTHPWRHDHVTRRAVRHDIRHSSHHHTVNPNLALAIAWQESGWQQHRVSSANAIGVMQVLPSTARWMSWYVGRHLNPYGLHDNITSGVVLLKVLRAHAKYRHAIGAYYQGLRSVRRDGLYRSTKRYVANVVAIKKRLVHGWNPG